MAPVALLFQPLSHPGTIPTNLRLGPNVSWTKSIGPNYMDHEITWNAAGLSTMELHIFLPPQLLQLWIYLNTLRGCIVTCFIDLLLLVFGQPL